MGFWNRFRRKPAPQKGHVNPTFTAARAFAGAKTSHLTAGWVPVSSSADMESFASLTRLRDRSRALVRDNAPIGAESHPDSLLHVAEVGERLPPRQTLGCVGGIRAIRCVAQRRPFRPLGLTPCRCDRLSKLYTGCGAAW